ncbi:stage II sporulation protein D [Bacillus sp. BGMRC 2118]|nr:stage II sporulation protein D [Bacillus sp. BGMRC 2118]
MKRLKPLVVLGSILFIVTLLIPTLLVLPFTDKTHGTLVEELKPQVMSAPEVKNQSSIDIPVYRSVEKKIENIPLEQYVVGVVASEMPAEFESEALKAQALAARTYVVRILLSDTKLGTPEGAKLTDSFKEFQAYKDMEELKAQWKGDFDTKIAKITEAVNATSGQILVYDGSPIDASFFSTSNGYTENSEEYWTNEIPYLRSVASPWDEKSPKFTNAVSISVSDFEAKLGVKLPSKGDIGKIISRTKGGRIGVVQVGGKEMKGPDVRDALGLNSSDFNWERKGNEILITTKGYGHGVGMSQYGANGMAQEGKTYQDIVTHYYKGIEISNIEPFINDITAQISK